QYPQKRRVAVDIHVLQGAVDVELKGHVVLSRVKSVDKDTERQRSSSACTWRFFSSMRATVSLPSARRVGGRLVDASFMIACASRRGSPGWWPFLPAREARLSPAVSASSSIFTAVLFNDWALRKSVRKAPGSTAVAWIPSGASSADSASLMPSTANFVAL